MFHVKMEEWRQLFKEKKAEIQMLLKKRYDDKSAYQG